MAEARDWRVHPNPETGEVDEQELAKTLFEVGVLLRRGGGNVALMANRVRLPDHPSELPTERVTVSVDVRWMARTDTPAKFEDVAPAPPVAVEPPPAPVAPEADPEGPEFETVAAAVAAGVEQ